MLSAIPYVRDGVMACLSLRNVMCCVRGIVCVISFTGLTVRLPLSPRLLILPTTDSIFPTVYLVLTLLTVLYGKRGAALCASMHVKHQACTNSIGKRKVVVDVV